MLRSAGYFAGLLCPFALEPCQRPHCQYSHSGEEAAGGSAARSEEMGKSSQELERINKEIEEVKTEVEEKRKKLSLYEHVAQESPMTTASNSICDVNDNGPSCPSRSEHASVEDQQIIASVSNKLSKPYNSMSNKKYVIDRRCPATDLEYDPLLNYSAGLLCSSSVKESENDSSKLKRSKTSMRESGKESPTKRSKVSPIRLEIKLQESDDDLVIDVPPLQPTIKKSRVITSPSDCSIEVNGCLNICEGSTDNIKTCVEVVGNESSQIVLISVDKPTNDCKASEREEEQFAQQVNSSDILKSIVLKEVKHDTNAVHVSAENTIGSPACVGKDVHNEASKEDESKNENSCEKSVLIFQNEEIKHTLKSGELSKTNSHQESLEDEPVLMQETSKQELAQVSMLQKNEICVSENIVSSDTSVSSDQPIFIDISSPEVLKTGHCNGNVKESEIIVLDSSSEEESDNCDQDIDISDSDDPMEECLRIFNEFAENESKKELCADQVFVEDHSETEASDTKSTDMVPGQRKRIAHPAKFDIKSNNEICVPLREPVPQPVPNVNILKTQQQAVQITAAVKSGQAFVAAASGHHTKSGMPTQVRRIGKIVYLNLLNVESSVPYRIPRNGVLQRNSLAAVPSKSNMPLKKIIQPSAKVSVRRRPVIVPESGSKVPHEMRQRYVNFFVEEYLKVCSTVNDAFDKALSEEKSIYDRCGSKNMYLNISVNTLKKLRDHGALTSDGIAPSGNKETNAAGSRKQEDLTGVALYRLLTDYLLNEEQLKENGYPRPNPDKPGSAILYNGLTKNVLADALRRVCCRCGETYAVTSQGKHVRKEECNYHSGKVLRHRVPGGLETRYSCCEAVVGTPGCQVAKLHVHDGQKDNLDGFVKTFKKPPPDDGNHGLFAVDCEMCYTTQGLNLTRVTVVDPSLQVVYDTFVKPDNEIIDYNTRFSGVTEDDLKNVTTTIRDVQAILLNLFSAESIVIGHSLENDLFALKLFHDTVVDTSIVFPHHLGLPNKKSLQNLMAEYLRRIIQDDVGGHDSREDASACMELLIWKVKEDTKGKRW